MKQQEDIMSFTKFVNEGANQRILNESSLSRIWKHIRSDKSFGVISPYRRDTPDENEQNYNELKHLIRVSKYGYIELIGGFNEEGTIVKEKSIFIPKIGKDELIELGIKYDQYSVIYKDANEFIELYTAEGKNKVRIERVFQKSKEVGQEKREDLNFDPELMKQIFSRLAKGSHKNKKSFVLEEQNEMFLYEVVALQFNQIAYGKKRIGKDEDLIRLL